MLILCNAPPCCAEDDGAHSILILHSYHHGYKWTDDITEGVRDALSGASLPLALHVEYMDTKRVAAIDYERDLAAFYQKKFSGIGFEVIVCSDNNAIDFMATRGRKIFPGTPVVFCGFNFLREEDMPNLRGFTGVNEEADLAGGIDLMLTLHPETKTIYVISDRTPTGLRVLERLEQITPRYRDRLECIFLDNLSMSDLLATVKTFKPGDLVFYSFFFRDQAGRFYEYDESIQKIARECPVPIYGAWDFSLGHGIVGGLLTSAYFQGEAAGKLALRILRGERVDQVPIVTESPNRYMFDYRRLKVFDIPTDRLPAEAIIINRPPSFYQQYRHTVWAGAVALGLQLAVIAFLTTNIIRRRRVENAIRQNQKRLNTILETANEGFWEIDPQAVGVNVNAELCTILNRTRSEIIGRPIYAFADAENRRIFETQLAMRRQGERSQYEIGLLRSDGTTVQCQFNSAPLFDDGGQFMGAFAMVTDISQRKRDEDTLKNREAMLQAIFESTDNGIAVTDENGRLSKMNRRFKELFPASIPHHEGNSAGDQTLKQWLEAHIPVGALPERLPQLSSSTTPEGSTRMRCRSGRVVDVNCYPLQFEAGTYGGYVFNFRDVSDRIRLESQLLQSQKMEALGTLTSGIAHDFNNILAAILGYTEILQYQFKDHPDALKKISRVLKASHRAKNLVQQIHSFSRPQQIEPKPLCAGLIVKEAVKLLQASLPPYITIQIDQRTRQDSVTVDPGQIHQVIMNLCTNAVHAMQNEGGVLTVIIDGIELEAPRRFYDVTLPAGPYLQLIVKDTGHGMSKEILEKIFDPYFTTKEKGQGTGLGLAVTLGIVKNHGGAIQVDSHEWQGSAFTVYLPLSIDAIPAAVEPLLPLPKGKGTVLLVDDEPDIASMMKEMLLHLGYQATAFTDSQRALAVFKDHPDSFDAAVVDMAMPGISGRELAAAMRAVREHMPIFLCTGYKDRTATDDRHKRLFNAVLIKPLELQALAEALHKAMVPSP